MRRLVFRAQAELELAAAIEWYRERNIAVAVEFAESVDRILNAILENPFQYQVVEGEARRAIIRQFRYTVIYLVKDDELVIASIFHTSRDPDIWRDRLR